MRTFLLMFALTIFVSTPKPDACQSHQSASDSEMGVAQYPRVSYLPEATERLMKVKASTWLLARVYHTDDSIKDVAKYFKNQAQTVSKSSGPDELVSSLLRDNWKISKGLVRAAPTLFGGGIELTSSSSTQKAETSFGVIVLEDSIVRIHLMSPHPDQASNNKLAPGTMIIMIRERIPQPVKETSNAEPETVYRGSEVTRRARVNSKPEPEYARSGVYGVVVLRAVLSATGKVTNIQVTKPLSEALTDAAIKAARKIKFEPAIKDGRYVSTSVQLEYNFLP